MMLPLVIPRSGKMTNEDIQAVEQAMGAIRLIRDQHASAEPGQRLSQEILQTLRGNGKSLFRVNMAEAINATLANKAVEPVARNAA
jgi:hypothetical protein